MSDYDLLESLDCESPVSGGLDESIYVIPAWAVISTPAFSLVPSVEPLKLVAGASSTKYKFPVGVLGFREQGQVSSQGDFTQILLEGYRNKLSPEHMDEIRKISPGHYVVIYVDTEKQQRVLGTKDKPLLFSWVADTGKRDSDKSGVAWKFEGVGVGPTVFQSPLIPPPNESVLPAAIINYIEDTGSDCSYNLQSFTSRQIAGNLITASTPDTAVDLIYQFYNGGNLLYVGRIDPGDDPTNVSNWTVTAGTRSAPNFSAEIIAGITGTNSVDFILDLLTISDILLTPGQLEVRLIVDEAGSLSPSDSVILELCYEAPGILSLNSTFPVDNATEIGIFLDQLIATFSEDIQAVSGTIYLRDISDNSIAESVSINHASIDITNNVLTWDIQANIETSTTYWVDIPNGVIQAVSGPNWPGISPQQWNFTTVLNGAPQAQNVALNSASGLFELGEDVNISWTYFDDESDVENTALTVVEINRYDIISDANDDINGTLLHTGISDYTITSNEVGKYIRAKVIPHALTGTSPGPVVYSSVKSITESIVFETTFNPATDVEFDPGIDPDPSDIPEWRFEDGSTIYNEQVSTTGNGLDGTQQQVVLAMAFFSLVSSVVFNDDKIVNTLDLTKFTGATIFNLRTNQITAINFPVSSAAIVLLDGSFNNLSTLDLSSLSNFRTQVLFNDNNITAVTWPGSVTNTFTAIYFDNNQLTSISFASFTNLSGVVSLANNPTLTTLTIGASGSNVTQIQTNNTGLTSLDFSTLTGCTRFYCQDTASLTAITFPTSSAFILILNVDNCTGLTDLNLSPFSNLGGQILAYNCDALTNVTIPVSTRSFSNLWIYNCAILTSLDFSNTSGTISSLAVSANPLMTSLTLGNGLLGNLYAHECDLGYIDFTSHSSLNSAGVFKIYDNGMTAAEVNQILVDLDGMLGVGVALIDISGTNAAPDGTSGGFDGTAAAISLAGKGHTVTTS